MKILMINQADIGGGAEKIALSLCEKLNQHQIKCDLYVDVKKSSLPFVYSFNRSNINKKLSKIINKGLNQQSRFCGSTNHIEEKLKEYDLVHIHNLHGNYLNLDILKKISDLNIPIVWTLHDIWPFTGRCCIEYDCEGFTRKCGECGGKIYSGYPKMIWDNSKKILEYKKQIILNSNITFVSPSLFVKSLYLKSFLKNKPIRVINNGIDIRKFDKQDRNLLIKKHNLDKSKIYILIIAAKLNNKSKGTKEAIDIINKIEDKKSIGIITVGSGLKENMIDSDIQVINYGYVNDAKTLSEIYEISDIFLNSTKADNFPTTNLESMACGTPVFASNIGGNLEQINEENGWIFDIENLNNASIDLENIIRNKKEINKKSKLSRIEALEKYNIDSMTNKYINLYNHLILEGDNK